MSCGDHTKSYSCCSSSGAAVSSPLGLVADRGLLLLVEIWFRSAKMSCSRCSFCCVVARSSSSSSVIRASFLCR
jgi:hypothetical protein